MTLGSLPLARKPISVGSLANLKRLAMAYNDKFLPLPAPLPEEFGALKKLKFLWMTQTTLIGGILETLINNLSSLEHLHLAINNLSGPIPGGLLMSKNFINNRLSGHIPSSIGAVNLKDIDLSNNQEHIFGDFRKLQNLRGFNLFWGSCRSLFTIQLSNNRFSGEIPAGIWTSPGMVCGNSFSGTLPGKLGSNLSRIKFNDNKFSVLIICHVV